MELPFINLFPSYQMPKVTLLCTQCLVDGRGITLTMPWTLYSCWGSVGLLWWGYVGVMGMILGALPSIWGNHSLLFLMFLSKNRRTKEKRPFMLPQNAKITKKIKAICIWLWTLWKWENCVCVGGGGMEVGRVFNEQRTTNLIKKL